MYNSKIILKQKPFPIGYFIVSGIVLLIGIFLFRFYEIAAIIVVLVGALAVLVSVFSNRDGVVINYNTNKYKEAYILGPIEIGKWKNLPEIQHISITRVVVTNSVYGKSGAKVSNQEKAFQINLIYGLKQHINLYETSEINEAFEKAALLSEKLHVNIYDATTSRGKWINSTKEQS